MNKDPRYIKEKGKEPQERQQRSASSLYGGKPPAPRGSSYDGRPQRRPASSAAPQRPTREEQQAAARRQTGGAAPAGYPQGNRPTGAPRPNPAAPQQRVYPRSGARPQPIGAASPTNSSRKPAAPAGGGLEQRYSSLNAAAAARGGTAPSGTAPKSGAKYPQASGQRQPYSAKTGGARGGAPAPSAKGSAAKSLFDDNTFVPHNKKPKSKTMLDILKGDSKDNDKNKKSADESAGGKASGAGKGNGKKGKMTKTAKRAIWVNLVKSVFILGCLCVVAISVFVVYLAGYVSDETQNEEAYSIDLDSLLNSQTGYLMAMDKTTGEYVEYQQLLGTSNSSWASLEDEIPEILQHAFVAVEDESFYEHSGFNLKRIIRAGLNEVFKFEQQSGASTINQQLIKNITGEDIVVAKDGSAVPGYQRKLKEIYRAYLMDKNYPKEIILEAYLNRVPLSGKIVGVKAAARVYFNKELSELTINECAMMAGITKHPTAYDPWENYEKCKLRRDDVLWAMLKNGYITGDEYDLYYKSEIPMYDYNAPDANVPVVGSTSSYFADTVIEEVIDVLIDRGIAKNPTEAEIMYYNSGWRIFTTVDIEIQQTMERIYEQGYTGEGAIFPETVFAEAYFDAAGNEVIPKKGEEDKYTKGNAYPQSAMVVMDYEGRLMGIVGGLGQRTVARGINRALTPRPIGSTIKPIVPYALALENGLINYSTMVPDSPSRPGDPARRDPETGVLINEWPQNIYGDGGEGVLVMAWVALAKSLNTIPVILGEFITPEAMFEYAEDTLRFSTLVSADDEEFGDDATIAPMALGALSKGITAYELAAAYQIIGNGGIYNTPRSFDRIEDADGNIIVDFVSEPGLKITAMSMETAYILNRMMANVLVSPHGTARGMKLNYMDSIAKTGSTDDYKDRWFIGLTPYYVSTVWWGYDYNQALRYDVAAINNPPPMAWKAVMEAVQADLPEIGWDLFAGANIVELSFCLETGGLAVEGCTEQGTGYYDNSKLDLLEECPLHSTAAVDYSDGTEPKSDDSVG